MVGARAERHLLPGRPGQEARRARSAQVEPALECGRIRCLRRDRALQHGIGAARQLQAQVFDLELPARLCEPQPHRSDRLATQIGLLDLEAHPRPAIGGQQLLRPGGELGEAVDGGGAPRDAHHPIEVEPARGEVHVEGERLAPVRAQGAGKDLQPAALVEGHCELRQGCAGRVGLDCRFQLEAFAPVARRLQVRVFARGALLCAQERATGEGQPRRQVALDARLAHEVDGARVDEVGGVGLRKPQRYPEGNGPVGLGQARRQSQVALASCRAAVLPLEAIRPLERGSRQFAVEPLEPAILGTVRAVQGEHPVADPERGQRDIGGHVAGRAQRLGEALPVPGALRVERQAQHGALELDLVHLHHPAEQRCDRQLDAQAVGLEEVPAEIRRPIADAHLLQAEVGARQQIEFHVAVDLHLAADDVLRLLLEPAAIAVPVDEIGNCEQCRDHRYDEDRNGNEQVIHGAAPRVGAAGLRSRGRACDARRTLPGCAKACVLPQQPMLLRPYPLRGSHVPHGVMTSWFMGSWFMGSWTSWGPRGAHPRYRHRARG